MDSDGSKVIEPCARVMAGETLNSAKDTVEAGVKHSVQNICSNYSHFRPGVKRRTGKTGFFKRTVGRTPFLPGTPGECFRRAAIRHLLYVNRTTRNR